MAINQVSKYRWNFNVVINFLNLIISSKFSTIVNVHEIWSWNSMDKLLIIIIIIIIIIIFYLVEWKKNNPKFPV